MTLDKDDLILRLGALFDQWDEFLVSRTDPAWDTPRFPGGWSLREVVLHLMAWQQISIARLEAAMNDTVPMLPSWLDEVDPSDAEERTGEFNARILDLYETESWPSVYRAWRQGFLRFLKLAEAVREDQMFDAGRYPWLEGYALSDVVSGSCEHHEEHLEELLSQESGVHPAERHGTDSDR